jgi:hypothetical protein
MPTLSPEKPSKPTCQLSNIVVRMIGGEFPVNEKGAAIIDTPFDHNKLIMVPEYECKTHDIKGSWYLMTLHLNS